MPLQCRYKHEESHLVRKAKPVRLSYTHLNIYASTQTLRVQGRPEGGGKGEGTILSVYGE